MEIPVSRAHPGRVSATNPRDEYEALVHVVDRLVRRIPWADEREVMVMVADEVAAMEGARLRGYIPTLVEARVLRRLRAPGPVALSA